MLLTRSRIRLAAPASMLLSVFAACESDKSEGDNAAETPAFEANPSLVQSALETPITDCQTAGLQCADAATNVDERLACADTFRDCLDTAAQNAVGVEGQVSDCRDKAFECYDNGGKLSECRTQFEDCSKTALDGLSNGGGSVAAPSDGSDAGVSSDAPSGGGLLGGGLSGGSVGGGLLGGGLSGGGLGGLSLLDGGGVSSSISARFQCLETMRKCVLDGNSSLTQCADEARACVTASTP